jgi:hypothetical protein
MHVRGIGGLTNEVFGIVSSLLQLSMQEVHMSLHLVVQHKAFTRSGAGLAGFA